MSFIESSPGPDELIPAAEAEKLALQMLSKKERGALRRAFTAFDMDGSNTIELNELYELFRVLNITNIPPEVVKSRFHKLDTDNSNSLDYSEFLAMFLAIKDQYQCTPEMAAAVLLKKPVTRTTADVDRLSYYLEYHVPLFSQLSRPMRMELCRHMSLKTYEEGDWLYTQGSPADATYIPLEGTLSVWANPINSGTKQGPDDAWLQTTPRDQNAGIDLNRHPVGGISFGSRSFVSIKSRAPSVAPSIPHSDDEESQGATEDGSVRDAGSNARGTLNQEPSLSRLTAATLDSLQKQMQSQESGRSQVSSRHTPKFAHGALENPNKLLGGGLKMRALRLIPQSPSTKIEDGLEDGPSASNRLRTPTRAAKGVAFGDGSPADEELAPQPTLRARHSSKPSLAGSSDRDAETWAALGSDREVDHPKRLPLAIQQKAGEGNESVDKEESSVGMWPSRDLQSQLSRNTRVSSGRLTRKPSTGSIALGSMMSMRARKTGLTKADPATVRGVLWSGEVSALTGNDQVGANLARELNWAVADMHTQASNHSLGNGACPQVPSFVGFCCPGQWLAEQSLLGFLGSSGAGKHQASVLAATTTSCCVLEATVFKAAMGFVRGGCSSTYWLLPDYLMYLASTEPRARSTTEDTKLVHFLSCVPSLAHLPGDIRLKLSRNLRPKNYASGEVVIRQGMPSDGMFIVLEGDVGVFQRPLGDQGLAWQLGKGSRHPSDPTNPQAQVGANSASMTHSPKHKGRARHHSTSNTLSPHEQGLSGERRSSADGSAFILERSTSGRRRTWLSLSGASSPIVLRRISGSCIGHKDEDLVPLPVVPESDTHLSTISAGASPFNSKAPPGSISLGTLPDLIHEAEGNGDHPPLFPYAGPQGAAVAAQKNEAMQQLQMVSNGTEGIMASEGGQGQGNGGPLSPRTMMSPRSGSAEPDKLSRLEVATGGTSSPNSPAAPHHPRPQQLSYRKHCPPQYSSLAIDTSSPACPDTVLEETDSTSSELHPPPTAPEARAFKRTETRPSDTGTDSGIERPRFGNTASASSSMHERHVITKNTKETTAAALRARHAQGRMAVGNVGGAQTITSKHVTDASKFAQMLGGQADSALVGLSTPRDMQQPKNIERLAESLEELFGPLQQVLGAGTTCGEMELISFYQDRPEAERAAASLSTPHSRVSTPRHSYRVSGSNSPLQRETGTTSPRHLASARRGRLSPDAVPEVRKRLTSVLALGPCSMLFIDVVAYRDILLAWRRQELTKRLEFYKGIPPLKGLRQQALVFIDAVVHWLTVKRNAVLQQVGEPLRGVCFIKTGQLGLYMDPARVSTLSDLQKYDHARELYKNEVLDSGGVPAMEVANSSMPGGDKRLNAASLFSSWAALRQVTLLGPGDFFGEDALVSGSHMCAVVAETTCEVGWIKPADMPLLERTGISQLLKYGSMRNAWRSKHRVRGPDMYHQASLRQTGNETGELTVTPQSAQRLEAALLQHAIAMGRMHDDGTLWVATAMHELTAARNRARGHSADDSGEVQLKAKKEVQSIMDSNSTLSVLQGNYDLSVYARWFLAEDNLRRRAASKRAMQEVGILWLQDSSEEEDGWEGSKEHGRAQQGGESLSQSTVISTGTSAQAAAGGGVQVTAMGFPTNASTSPTKFLHDHSPSLDQAPLPQGHAQPLQSSPDQHRGGLTSQQRVMGIKRAPHQTHTQSCLLRPPKLPASLSAIDLSQGLVETQGAGGLLALQSVLAKDQLSGCTAELPEDKMCRAGGWRMEGGVNEALGAKWAEAEKRQLLLQLWHREQTRRRLGAQSMKGSNFGLVFGRGVGDNVDGKSSSSQSNGEAGSNSDSNSSSSSSEVDESMSSTSRSSSRHSGVHGNSSLSIRSRHRHHSRHTSIALPTVLEASYISNPEPAASPSQESLAPEGSSFGEPQNEHQQTVDASNPAGNKAAGAKGSSRDVPHSDAAHRALAPVGHLDERGDGLMPAASDSQAPASAGTAARADAVLQMKGQAGAVEHAPDQANAETGAAVLDSMADLKTRPEGRPQASAAPGSATRASSSSAQLGSKSDTVLSNTVPPHTETPCTVPPNTAPSQASPSSTAALNAAQNSDGCSQPAVLEHHTQIPLQALPQAAPHTQSHQTAPPLQDRPNPSGLSARLLAHPGKPAHHPAAPTTALDLLAPNIVAETVTNGGKTRKQQAGQQQGQQPLGGPQGCQLVNGLHKKDAPQQAADDSADWATFHPRIPFRGFVKKSPSIAAKQLQQLQQHQQQPPVQRRTTTYAHNGCVFLRPKPSPRAMSRMADGVSAKMKADQEKLHTAFYMSAPLTPRPKSTKG